MQNSKRLAILFILCAIDHEKNCYYAINLQYLGDSVRTSIRKSVEILEALSGLILTGQYGGVSIAL